MIIIKKMKLSKNKLNIIYICTAEKGPSGGAKIIYNHSDHINKLKMPNVSSEVLHIQKKKISKWNASIRKKFKITENGYSGWSSKDITINKSFKSKWFKNNIQKRENFLFNKKNDFIIFPEIFAHLAKELCVDKKIPYGRLRPQGFTFFTLPKIMFISSPKNERGPYKLMICQSIANSTFRHNYL
mgnify:CR=1 FL=1